MGMIGLDPQLARDLTTVMRAAGEDADGLSREVTGALNLSELDSTTPGDLIDLGGELDRYGVVISVRADIAEGFVIDPKSLVFDLGLTLAEAEAVTAILNDAAIDLTGKTPLLDAVIDSGISDPTNLDDIAEALGIPRSVLDLHITALASQGIVEDDEVLAALDDPNLRIDSVADLLDTFDKTLPDDVIENLDSFFLDDFLNGKEIDINDLSSQEIEDLRDLARELGAEDEKLTYRSKYYSTSDKEDRYRTIDGSLAGKSAPLDLVIGFVAERLFGGLTYSTTTHAIGKNLDRFASGELTVREASEASGLSEAEVSRSLAVVAEAQFRRTGERIDLDTITGVTSETEIIDGLAPVPGDELAVDGEVNIRLAAAARRPTNGDGGGGGGGDKADDEDVFDPSDLSDDELAAELDDIAAGVTDTRGELAETQKDARTRSAVLGTISVGAAFTGPIGVGVSILAGGMSLLHDNLARGRVEDFDKEIRELQEQQDDLRQEQLDRALKDAEAFDIDTKDIDRLNKEIRDIDKDIAELDASRVDTVDAGFISRATGEVSNDILGAASATAKGLNAIGAAAAQGKTAAITYALSFFTDNLDNEARKKLDELVEKRERFRREQLREAGDQAGVFTEEEAVEKLADAEFELSKEIAEAEKREKDLTDQRTNVQEEQERRNEAIEAERKATERREEERRERDERSEPNGGRVRGADPGVGRNDVPDSF